MKKRTLIFVLLLSFQFSHAQGWVEKMQNPNANFYEIKAEFENYWSTRDNTEKGKGYKVFKRWENFVERRVYPSGNLSLLNLTAKNYNEFVKNNQQQPNSANRIIGSGNNMIASSTWTAIGPMGAISGNAGGQLLKAGRVGFITVDPNNASNLWIGAPAGGLWKSTNSGASWTTNTDFLPVIGCSDLAIDPTNSNIMYLATGDGDAGDTRSIGVLKSINGGTTWNTTGLTNAVTNYFLIRRLLVNPSNTQIVLAATTSGIYRTTNGGTNWTLTNNVGTYDIEFKPGDPNTVYATGSDFRISTNGGASFTQVSAGIPNTGCNRMAIAVTPADANYVYVIASSSANSGLLGIYQSTNSASSFAQKTTTLNLLGYSNLGNDTGGQGWYDLCIAASPLNKDEVVVGGVNVWRTTNAGTSWSIYGHWVANGAPFTHADQHDLEFDALGSLYDSNDGTVYKRVGGAWNEISGTINISQIYKIGMSSLTPNKWITGHQDNGTSIWTGSTYTAALGGDGMDCFIDRTNDANMFGEYQNGVLRKSTNGGSSWFACVTGMTGTPPWVTVWKQDPQNASTLYCGYTDLFVSTNLASSWGTLAPLPGAGTVREFAIAPSNNQIIYVLKSSGIYKTTNAGASWQNVTGTVPVASALPEFISIDPLDPNNAWVVLSGYSAGNKVFMTTNGGATWTNYSANLPNIPANCSVYQPGSNDMIYIGMDVGIYYRDNVSATWTLYNNNLPNVPIADLEISPASPTLLHAATYGRGVWTANLFVAGLPPVSSFSFATNALCPAAIITFSDQSVNAPTSWNWSVLPSAGVTIVTPLAQNPSFTFQSGGTYTVTLQANNAIGNGTSYTKTISIANPLNFNIANPSQTVCVGNQVTFNASGATNYSWSSNGGNSASANFTPTSAGIYSVTGTINGCVFTKTASVALTPNPTVTISGANSICFGNSATFLASGASSYTWNNGNTSPVISVSPSVTTSYSLIASGAYGCTTSVVSTLTINPLPTLIISSQDSSICLEESVLLNVSGASTYTWLPGNILGANANYTPSATAIYTCSGIDANGCANTGTFEVRVSVCTGISKTLLVDNAVYMLFPNPTKGKLSLKVNKPVAKEITVEVMDALGKLVFTQHLVFNESEKTMDVNIAQLAPGNYFVKLVSDSKSSEIVKIIKE